MLTNRQQNFHVYAGIARHNYGIESIAEALPFEVNCFLVPALDRRLIAKDRDGFDLDQPVGIGQP